MLGRIESRVVAPLLVTLTLAGCAPAAGSRSPDTRPSVSPIIGATASPSQSEKPKVVFSPTPTISATERPVQTPTAEPTTPEKPDVMVQLLDPQSTLPGAPPTRPNAGILQEMPDTSAIELAFLTSPAALGVKAGDNI